MRRQATGRSALMRASLAALLLFLALAVTGCSIATSGGYAGSDVGTTTPTGEKGSWAVYWYCCGSDLESQSGAATEDISEMLSADVGSDVKVVLETGGTSYWRNNVMDPDVIQRYEYGGTSLNKVDEQPQADMGDPSTLSSFLRYCKTNYPADHTMLVLWDHGGGSVAGACFDENYDYDSLTLPELDQAIGSVYSDGSKLDVVGMDTCLMATLDNANVMKKYASYLVASEEVEPGNGWDYDRTLAALGQDPSMSAETLAKTACDAFEQGCEDSGTDKSITMSVTDLSQVDGLVSAVNGMGKEVLTAAAKNSKVVGQFGRRARASVNFGGNNASSGYANMVDLGDLMRKAQDLVPSSDQQVLEALGKAVIYQVRGPYRKQASGLSTYYCYDGDEQNAAAYAQVAASPVYANFIRYSLGEDVTGDVQGDTGVETGQIQGFSQTPALTISDDQHIQMTLDPSSLDSVASVTFNLIYVDEANDEMLVLGTDDDIDADWDAGVFKDNFRGVWGSMDGHYASLTLSDEGDDTNTYTVPIKLNGTSTNMVVSYDFTTSSYSIIGVEDSIDQNTGMAGKTTKKLARGDQIVLVSDAVSLSDTSQVIEYDSDPITYTGPDQFTEIDLYDGQYAYQYTVTDTTGKQTNSDYAFIDYENGVATRRLG